MSWRDGRSGLLPLGGFWSCLEQHAHTEEGVSISRPCTVVGSDGGESGPRQQVLDLGFWAGHQASKQATEAPGTLTFCQVSVEMGLSDFGFRMMGNEEIMPDK